MKPKNTMRYVRIMDTVRLTHSLNLTPELKKKFAELRETINPDAVRKLYEEIAALRNAIN